MSGLSYISSDLDCTMTVIYLHGRGSCPQKTPDNLLIFSFACKVFFGGVSDLAVLCE